MSMNRRPKFEVTLNSENITQGDELRIRIKVDQFVNSLYMRIINHQGVEIWKSTLLARGKINSYSYVIGTKYFETSGKYQIQISSNLKYSPIGVAYVNVKKKPFSIFPYIPLLAPLGLVPILVKPFTIKPDDDNKIEVYDPDSEWFRYITERDGRVCKICRKYDGRIYSPKAKRPEIPQHKLCRCYYEVVEYRNLTAKNLKYLQHDFENNNPYIRAVKAVKTAHKFKSEIEV